MSKRPFRTSGVAFLSEEAEDFEEKVVAAHNSFFEVFTRASVAAYDVLGRLTVDPHDRVQIYAACTIARLCEACQAAAYLGARGFAQETAVQVRVALEVLLKFKAALTNPSLAESIMDGDLLEQRKLGNLLLSGKVSGLTPANLAEIEKRQQEVGRQIKAQSVKKVSIEELAREVDALSLYERVYRSTSASVHVSPRALIDYVAIHPNTEQPQEIVYGPGTENIELHLYTITHFLLVAISLLERHHGLRPPDEFSSIGDDLKSLLPEAMEA